MEIKPKFDAEAINIPNNVRTVSLTKNSKIIKDPKNQISNGIYRVIRWEKIMLRFTWVAFLTLMLAMSILIVCYALVLHTSWIAYSLPTIIGLIAFWKVLRAILELSSLKKAIIKYREDLMIGIDHTPPFLVKLYRNLNCRQIGHNWLTFFCLLNGGIMTLILWWLKDVNWWIFTFDQWVRNLFSNPNLMIWFLTIALLLVALSHIVISIQRKHKIMEMDAYFGVNIVPYGEIAEIKKERNKFYRRLFMLYVITIFIIPLLIKIILRLVRGKRK